MSRVAGQQMTDRVYEFAVDYAEKWGGNAPTIREIRDAVGLASTSSVGFHLNKLKKAGLIDLVTPPGRKGRVLVICGGEWSRPDGVAEWKPEENIRIVRAGLQDAKKGREVFVVGERVLVRTSALAFQAFEAEVVDALGVRVIVRDGDGNLSEPLWTEVERVK